MIWLRLKGIAETPIALPQRSEAGNLYETLPEIPGAAVRGAFAGQHIRQHGVSENFARLFENPNIRFGAIRPLPRDFSDEIKAVPFPVPRSAHSCKYEGGFKEGHGVFDSLLFQARADDPLLNEDDEKKGKCPQCSAPLEGLDHTWMVADWGDDLDDGKAIDYDPDLRLNTHVGLGPAVGKGANLYAEGRLFSLQHFPAGTKFHGWIAIREQGVNRTHFGFEGIGESHTVLLRVGRRSKSYGALCLWITGDSAQSPWECSHGSVAQRLEKFQAATDWVKTAKSFSHQEEDFTVFSLTCLTDLILLDDFLRPCRSITAYQMACRLGLDWCSSSRPLTGTRLISGWNAAHRLPKENESAIVAGSVFLFAVKKKELEERKVDLLQKLINLENNGLGWRRSEGFGQVLVCDPFHLQAKRDFVQVNSGKVESREAVKLNPPIPHPPMTAQEDPFGQAVFDFLDDNAKVLYDKRKALTKTQLNGLRDRVQRYERFEKSDSERKKLLKEHLEFAKSKTGPWAEVKVGKNRSLADALITLFGLTEETTLWKEVRQKATDFVKGALLITTSKEKAPLKLKAILKTKEEENV